MLDTLLVQEQGDAADHAGPLAEVAFWRSRTKDLAGIRDQLDDRRKPARFYLLPDLVATGVSAIKTLTKS